MTKRGIAEIVRRAGCARPWRPDRIPSCRSARKFGPHRLDMAACNASRQPPPVDNEGYTTKYRNIKKEMQFDTQSNHCIFDCVRKGCLSQLRWLVDARSPLNDKTHAILLICVSAHVWPVKESLFFSWHSHWDRTDRASDFCDQIKLPS